MVRHEQVNSQGRVNLDEHSILRASDKAFNVQILFDLTEEYFDLPTFFVDVGNGFGTQPKVIGQKILTFPGLGIPVAYPAQTQGSPTVLHLDNMVRGDAGFTVDRTAFLQLEYGVIFEACKTKKMPFVAKS